MMKHPAELDAIAVIGFMKRMDGSDFANGPHRISKIVIQHFGLFFKFLKKYDESMVDFLSTNRFRPSKLD